MVVSGGGKWWEVVVSGGATKKNQHHSQPRLTSKEWFSMSATGIMMPQGSGNPFELTGGRSVRVVWPWRKNEEGNKRVQMEVWAHKYCRKVQCSLGKMEGCFWDNMGKNAL